MRQLCVGLSLFLTTALVGQPHIMYSPGDTNKPIDLEEAVILQQPDVFEDSTLAFYETSRFSSLDALLHHMPDIRQVSRGVYAREPIIHGMSASRIKVTLDGMHLYGASIDGMDPITAYVEPANCKDIELGTGLLGLVFGPGIGGSLNLHTARPMPGVHQAVRGMLGSDYHSISNGQDVTMQLMASKEKWATEITGTYRHHNPYQAGGGEAVDNTQFNKANASWALTWMPIAHHTWKADVLVDESWNMGFAGMPVDVSHAGMRIVSLDHEWLPPLGSLKKWHSRVYGTQIRHVADNQDRNAAIRRNLLGVSHSVGAYSETFWHRGSHYLLAKLDVFNHLARADMTITPENSISGNVLTLPPANRLQSAMYLRYQWHHHKQGIQIDARLDHAHTRVTSEEGISDWAARGYNVGLADNRIAANLGVTWSYEWAHTWSTHLTAGYSERMPALSEMFGAFQFNAQDEYEYIGNPDITNERAWQATATLLMKGHHITWNVKIFGYRFADYMVGHADTAWITLNDEAKGVKQFRNIPRAASAGASASMHWHLTHHWSLIGNAEYIVGWLEDGEPLPQLPPFMGVAAMRYTRQGWFVQGESDWALPQERVNHLYGEHPSHGHSIWNLRGVYEFHALGYTWAAEAAVENLLDEEYHLFLDWGEVPRQGRNLRVGLEMHF